jgi:arginase family enzyme
MSSRIQACGSVLGRLVFYTSEQLRQVAVLTENLLSPVFITIDIYALDPSSAPGTGTPMPGGPTTLPASEVLRNLAGLKIVGADRVEVAPVYDLSSVTTPSAAAISRDLMHLLCRTGQASQEQVMWTVSSLI